MSKQVRAVGALIAAGLLAGGCGEPGQIITATPPGVDPRSSLIPKEEPAEAVGETAAVAKPKTLGGLVPSPPTAKGETKATASGVEYETVKEGTGDEVKVGQTVTVHYVGTLDDGRKFDSSRDKNDPYTVTIGVGSVIKGWDQAIPGMKVGEIRKLTVPPSAGYGALGAGERVPPNATLHFEVELISVK